jgi:hypothetical protein
MTPRAKGTVCSLQANSKYEASPIEIIHSLFVFLKSLIGDRVNRG